MSEHLEIEFKTLVSPQDFKRLIDHFSIQKTDPLDLFSSQ